MAERRKYRSPLTPQAPSGPLAPGAPPSWVESVGVPQTSGGQSLQGTLEDMAAAGTKRKATQQLARQLDKIARFESELSQYGIPFDDPTIQVFVDMGAVDAYFDDQGVMTQDGKLAISQIISSRLPAQENPYTQERSRLGFSTGFDPSFKDERTGTVRDPKLGEVRDHYANRDTGGIIFRNGVVVDSAQGTVAMPFDPDVVGSEAWLDDAQRTWSEQRVIEQKKYLKDMGYYPGETKNGAFTVEMKDALRMFHQQRYLNGGRPIASEAAGSQATQTQDLSVLSSGIRNDVRAQYQALYGEDPTDEELKRWTQFIVSQGNSLQKGGKGLAPSTALAESEEQFIEKTSTDPNAVEFRETIQENTSLKDALTNAVSVARGFF